MTSNPYRDLDLVVGLSDVSKQFLEATDKLRQSAAEVATALERRGDPESAHALTRALDMTIRTATGGELLAHLVTTANHLGRVPDAPLIYAALGGLSDDFRTGQATALRTFIGAAIEAKTILTAMSPDDPPPGTLKN